MESVISKFRSILRCAGRVVIMQHRIPESTIAFYTNAMGLQWDDVSVTRRKLDRPVTLHHTKYVKNSFILEALLIDHCISNYDKTLGRSLFPIIVFTTRADHAGMLTWSIKQTLKERIPGEDGVLAASRVKGIWAHVQKDSWVTKFLKDPNLAASECDVCVVTSVLQAGHSLDKHFRTSFAFLFCDVLTYREELQFTSRLRFLGRTDMMEYRYRWLITICRYIRHLLTYGQQVHLVNYLCT